MTRQYGERASVKDYSRTRLLNSSFNCKKASPTARARPLREALTDTLFE